MKIILESTTKIVTINGIEARVWEGTTARGARITALIPRVAVLRSEDQAEFERDLLEQRPPSPQTQAWPARFLLPDE